MFAVAAADRNISSIENAEITAIAIELDFTDAEIASIRVGYREQLAVLKDRPD
jgi:hypothetical protein